MDAIPLHKIAIVLPFTRFLSEIGAPVEHGFRQARLPFGALENVNNCVPTHRFWLFVGDMARLEGIEDLGYRVGQRFGLNCIQPGLSTLLCQSPTLYHALTKTINLANKSTSRARIGFFPQPLGDHVHCFHQPSFDTRNQSFDHFNWFALTALVEVVRLFAGSTWQPTEIGLATRHVPCRYIREQLLDTHLRTSQPYSYIALESALLSRPPVAHEASTTSSSLCSKPTPDDFIGSLKQALHAYVRECHLTIEFVAELCNTSKRTLQRRLAMKGTQFSELLDQVRFEAAANMLRDPDMKVIDVAHKLGYSDASHFSRAYRRIAGVNPRSYRRHYQH